MITVLPTYFLTFARLDLACKYLYVKNYVEDLENDHIVELYEQHILKRTQGKEKKDKFIPRQYKKETIADYTTSFNQLITSFQKQGFDPAYPINYSQNGFINGAHRIACSMYFKTPIPVVKIDYFKKIEDWDRSWFEKHKFINSSILLLEQTTQELLNEQL